MPPWRRPEPMGPMPYYSPESYMHPQPASYMHPQPVEPADMQPAQPEEEHPKMVTRHVKYLPLSPIGWGMIADDEGVQVRQLTSDLKGCEGECTKDEKIWSRVSRACLQLLAAASRFRSSLGSGVRALDKSAFAGPLLNVDPPSSIVQPTVPATTGFILAFVSVSVELGTGIGRRTVKPKRRKGPKVAMLEVSKSIAEL
ncbi:unnamed protein product, partial [Symbiodinium necroappetens]